MVVFRRHYRKYVAQGTGIGSAIPYPDTVNSEEVKTMNDHRRINLLLKKVVLYLQFLNEDMDSIEAIREDIACRIEELLKEATRTLRESVNLLNLEVRKARKEYGGSHS